MEKVTFVSEGITLVGHLFLPETRSLDVQLPAIICGGSWLTVKEQMAGHYAQKLAKLGFAALAFDFRYFGESDGEPRQYESGTAKTEDFKNAMTFLQSLPIIDPKRIGGLAICASAGYMARAVAEDDRFRAFVTVAGWFQHPDTTPMFYGGVEGIQHRIDLATAAWNEYRQSSQMAYVPAYDPNNPDAAMFFEVDYYGDSRRGAIPQWTNRFAVASWLEWLQLNAIDGIAEKITVPTLHVHSDSCVLPDNVRRFYDLVRGEKAMYWSAQGAQTDYYDRDIHTNKAAQIAAVHFKDALG
jgi:uncharacterized protein